MDQNQLFSLTLGLTEPWYVASLDFSAEDKRLEIGIDFRRGGMFPCPECGAAGCKAYDTEQREWRHLNFFEHQTVLRARVPRIDCTRCGVRPVNVPWSRPGSGFTLLFEALVLAIAEASLGVTPSIFRAKRAWGSHLRSFVRTNIAATTLGRKQASAADCDRARVLPGDSALAGGWGRRRSAGGVAT